MANHLALATVTEALRLRLAGAIGAHVSGVDVVARRPEATDGQSTSHVTVFLYRVTPNAALRNADLPTRGSNSTDVRRRPRAAVDLHYLLSFSGDEEQLTAQRMLGTSLACLHSEPGLTRAELSAVSLSQPWLSTSDLAQDSESVILTPSDLTLDDLSKLWSVFLQIPYRLSVAYSASVVLVEAPIDVLEPLPVQQGGVDAVPARQPVVDQVRVVGAVTAGTPIRVELLGRNLRGPVTVVRFDDGEPVAATSVTDRRIVVETGDLPAGVHAVQVVHRLAIGVPPVPHDVVDSAGIAFVLRPSVEAVVDGDAVEVTFAPPLAEGQRVSLLLNELVDAAATGTAGFHRLAPETAPVAGATTLGFLRGAVPAGTYLVRVQVDGAESSLDFRRGQTPPTPPAPSVTLP